MRAQPRTQQRPKAFHGIDMDRMETVTILVTGVFSTAVTHALVHIPPLWQGRINHILVRIDHRAGFDRGLDERSDGLLLHVLQHDDSDRAAALDHPEDRWLFLLEGAPTGCTLEPPTTWSATRGGAAAGAGGVVVGGNVHGDIHVHSAPATETFSPALRDAYLRRVMDRCGTLSLTGIDPAAGQRDTDPQLRLNAV